MFLEIKYESNSCESDRPSLQYHTKGTLIDLSSSLPFKVTSVYRPAFKNYKAMMSIYYVVYFFNTLCNNFVKIWRLDSFPHECQHLLPSSCSIRAAQYGTYFAIWILALNIFQHLFDSLESLALYYRLYRAMASYFLFLGLLVTACTMALASDPSPLQDFCVSEANKPGMY